MNTVLSIVDSVHLHWQKDSEGNFTVGGVHQLKEIIFPDGKNGASILWSMNDTRSDIQVILESPEPSGADVHTDMTQISRY